MPPNGNIDDVRLRRYHRGFTLAEMMVAVAVLAVVFSIGVRVIDGLRDQAKEQQAKRLVTTLAAATELYARVGADDGPDETRPAETGAYPPGAFDGSPEPCLSALLAVPQTRGRLADLGWPWASLLDDPGAWTDPWGRPMRYVAPVHDEQAVTRNGGIPFWVCAGPDGRFGDASLAEQSDNISSDEPM